MVKSCSDYINEVKRSKTQRWVSSENVRIRKEVILYECIIHDDISLIQSVIPGLTRNRVFFWIPAFAGMTAIAAMNVVVNRNQMSLSEDWTLWNSKSLY